MKNSKKGANSAKPATTTTEVLKVAPINLPANTEVTQSESEGGQEMDQILFPIERELKAIRTTTGNFMVRNFEYNLETSVLVGKIRAYQKEIAGKNKMYQVRTKNGELADLCKVKTDTKTGTLGFWEYLYKDGFLPFGPSQSMKFGRIETHYAKFAEIDHEIVVDLGLNDINRMDKLASVFSKENGIDEFRAKLAEPAKDREERQNFSYGDDKLQINCTFLVSAHKTTANAKVNLLNALFSELGFEKLTTTNQTATIEAIKKASRAAKKA